MRYFLTAAAALAACGLIASTAARAETPFVPGGPVKVGDMCKVTTDAMGNDSFGYYEPCPQQVVRVSKRTNQLR
jgi:hypothetical protein